MIRAQDARTARSGQKGRSSCSRVFDAGDGNAERHQTEQDNEKRQVAEEDETEGKRGKKQGCRAAAMRHEQPYASCYQKPGRRRRNPTEDVPENRQVSIFKT